jgi:hypothetical protein
MLRNSGRFLASWVMGALSSGLSVCQSNFKFYFTSSN